MGIGMACCNPPFDYPYLRRLQSPTTNNQKDYRNTSLRLTPHDSGWMYAATSISPGWTHSFGKHIVDESTTVIAHQFPSQVVFADLLTVLAEGVPRPMSLKSICRCPRLCEVLQGIVFAICICKLCKTNLSKRWPSLCNKMCVNKDMKATRIDLCKSMS